MMDQFVVWEMFGVRYLGLRHEDTGFLQTLRRLN